MRRQLEDWRNAITYARQLDGVDPDRIVTIPLGVDTDRFHDGRRREPGRLVCVASADQPLKGVPVLLRALAKVREEHPDVRLTLISKLKPKGEASRLLDRLRLRDAVDLVSGVDDDELAVLRVPDLDRALHAADLLMYGAKRSGGGQVHWQTEHPLYARQEG